MSMKPEPEYDQKNQVLPRSLYVPQTDPRANIRELIDSIFSDKFMIFLSLFLIPLIIVPLLYDFNLLAFNTNVIVFTEICDWIIIILFVAEYITKLFAAENRWKHFTQPWHILDLIIIILPFIQYLPILEVGISGSWSLLLRLLRLPRALAVGSRVIAGRRNDSNTSKEQAPVHPMVLNQVDSDYKTTENITWDDLKAHLADQSCHEWIAVRSISDEGFRQLSHILGISELHFKTAIVDDIYPHIDYVQKASFIFVQSGEIKYPQTTSNYLTISRAGMIVICNGKKIITVTRHNNDLIDEVLSLVLQKETDSGFVVPVLYGILEIMLEDYRSVLSEIELEMLKISNTPRAKLPRDFLERIYQLDKEVSRLGSNLVHFKDMLGIIISKKLPLEGFSKDSEEVFHILLDDANYLNELSHDLIGNLRSTIDLYINETSFETNKILKILAVITAISVIPTAVSGILGTNLLDTPYGASLWQLTFIIAVSMAFVGYTFIKLGWLKR